jgi:phosphatidylinositol-3-phosphatase
MVLLAGAFSGVVLSAVTAAAKDSPAPSSVRPCGTSRTPPLHYRHVVWILMENTSYVQVVRSPDAPYLTSIARRCGVAANYSAESHPSLPNYIALTSGSTQGITDDDDPSAHPLAVPSIFSQLGGRWRVLAESMPSNCAASSAHLYAVRHNPAVYYTNIHTHCERQDIPLAAVPDISARFTFVVPNLCHDMHDCSTRTGDSWLAVFLPKILNTAAYRSGTTAVFVTWDEGSGDNHVATLVIAPSVPRGIDPTQSFSHYSLLRTTEDLLGIRAHLAGAATAAGMRSAFHL